jgi:hypothetical protein
MRILLLAIDNKFSTNLILYIMSFYKCISEQTRLSLIFFKYLVIGFVLSFKRTGLADGLAFLKLK